MHKFDPVNELMNTHISDKIKSHGSGKRVINDQGKIFDSTHDAARSLNRALGYVGRAIKTGRIADGCTWRYLDE